MPIDYIAKMKKWQKPLLLPLYEENVVYLAKTIKWAADRAPISATIEGFMHNVREDYQPNALCMEIAINEYFGAHVQPAYNENSLESVYEAKEKQIFKDRGLQGHFSRNLRVKIQYQLLLELWEDKEKWAEIDAFQDWEIDYDYGFDAEGEILSCPICRAAIGYIDDDARAHLQDPCEHVVLDNDAIQIEALAEAYYCWDDFREVSPFIDELYMGKTEISFFDEIFHFLGYRSMVRIDYFDIYVHDWADVVAERVAEFHEWLDAHYK